jgi:signal transduction histidine kinase
MSWSSRIGLAIAFLFLAALEPAVAEPRQVLLLHSYGPHFSPWRDIAGRLREELIGQSPHPIDLYEASLQGERLGQSQDEEPFIDYLRALFSKHSLDLVVAMGAPAARFFLRYRPIFPSTPLLITGADERALNGAALTSNDTTVAVWFDQAKQIENILQVLPDTNNIAVATGASPIEKFWLENLRREYQSFTNRVTFDWLNELSLEEMLKRVATLPPRSAIYYNHIHVDARGVPQENDRALSRLREVARAPIFSFIDSNFGQGIVGGPLVSTQRLARESATVAIRILSGETPGRIKTPPLGLEAPVYDWRELQRWKISEARLPPGSIVKFREPTAWDRYRWQITSIFLALLVQSVLIAFLLERLRRRKAETRSRKLSLEVMHLNRAAEAGALSASFAHDLGQPTLAIALNAQRVTNLLSKDRPELGKIKEAVIDISRANDHAAAIIKQFRKLLKRRSDSDDQQETDLSTVIADALSILSAEADRRQVVLLAEGHKGPLLVSADPIHILQVLLNLATNAMDAMADNPSDSRLVVIRTTMHGDSKVEVVVSDSGPGIQEQVIDEVFDTFYTTKQDGTGIGLSIARTIVDTYGGKIWAENRPEGGAAFHFTIPFSSSKPAQRKASLQSPARFSAEA